MDDGWAFCLHTFATALSKAALFSPPNDILTTVGLPGARNFEPRNFSATKFKAEILEIQEGECPMVGFIRSAPRLAATLTFDSHVRNIARPGK